MKKLICTKEGEWIDSTKDLYGNTNFPDPMYSPDDVITVEKSYMDAKPTLYETDSYELTSCEVIFHDDKTVTGVLKCTVNAESIQVEF